jgi:hypothetical protein
MLGGKSEYQTFIAGNDLYVNGILTWRMPWRH